MSFRELFIRYLILAPGVFFLCFGIAFITKAGLGTSPIASIPYSLSLILPRFTMVAISSILCLVFLHRLSGVREGTVICALFTGNIVKLYRLILGKLFPEQTWMQIPQK